MSTSAFTAALTAALLSVATRSHDHDDARFPSRAKINRRRQAKADAAIASGRRRPVGKRRKAKNRKKGKP